MVGPSNGINPIWRVYRQEKVQGSARPYAPTPARPMGKDEVVISEEARMFALAQQAVQQAPEVRPEKVAAYKQAVDSGTYRVPASQVAEALLRTLRGEKV